MMDKEEPRFKELDGCINCSTYKSYRSEDKNLQMHEATAACLLSGCVNYGHDVLRPYIGTHELENVLESGELNGEELSEEKDGKIREILELRRIEDMSYPPLEEPTYESKFRGLRRLFNPQKTIHYFVE